MHCDISNTPEGKTSIPWGKSVIHGAKAARKNGARVAQQCYSCPALGAQNY